jgi:hypothetical protein
LDASFQKLQNNNSKQELLPGVEMSALNCSQLSVCWSLAVYIFFMLCGLNAADVRRHVFHIAKESGKEKNSSVGNPIMRVLVAPKNPTKSCKSYQIMILKALLFLNN